MITENNVKDPTFLDLSVLAVGLAQQDRGRRAAVYAVVVNVPIDKKAWDHNTYYPDWNKSFVYGGTEQVFWRLEGATGQDLNSSITNFDHPATDACDFSTL